MAMVYRDVTVPETGWFQRIIRRRTTKTRREIIYVGVVVDGQIERRMNGPAPDAHIVARDPLTYLTEVKA